jgi:hypothetical protein
MRVRAAAAALLLAAAAFTAGAQQAPKAPAAKPAPAPEAGRDAFKGKLKPGLYEMTVEADMTGMPGIPKDKALQKETRQKCITQQEVDRGIESDPNCPMTAFAAAGNKISMAARCKDGAALETTMLFNPGGYSAEMKVSGMHEGKKVGSTHKMTTRYLGACK